MRRVIYGILDTPWGFRITCGVLFVVVMVGVRYGLSVLRDTQDRGLILGVCIPFIAAGLLVAWLVDRHRARSH